MLGVAKKEIQRRSELRRYGVTGAVDAHTVVRFQQPFDIPLPGGRLRGDVMRQKIGPELQSLEAPADPEQTPAGVLCHVVQGESGQCGQ